MGRVKLEAGVPRRLWSAVAEAREGWRHRFGGGGLWEMARGFRATAVSAFVPHSATAVQKRAWRLDFSVGALMGFGAGYKPALHITDFCGCVRGRRRG